ncbi:acetylornithine transaminase [Arthrobacter sp. FW306-05-C]|uniref:acetylornithine transaminase n=1 Tax=Arthrobacter TaxID=1663 RepID=UPI001EF0DC4D|nr:MULTISPECIES: acetylornithine transaminase [Arthrobacter]MDP9988517.1 acetylornithine aminotransferase [Arthrobacter oryzae]UKA68156.1 acetylornithine transaminase [Arthrobacter sp. FW306-05-C]UKA72683.1 acetylornithine transaminase [Arthrobacter sp. FW306-06-A]UKA76914.1 acetylornithine transaminase [Arthrobacter sp. FW306-07-I]
MNTMEKSTVTELVETTGHAGSEWLSRYSSSLMNVFGTPQRVLVRGAGCLVWDADGKEYLDLLGGIAVNALGHAHPFVTSVIASQLATLGHVSNFFTSPTQVALAEKLLELAHAPAGSKVFFSNSGTEANEAAFKLARRNTGTDGTKRTRIIALEGAFHGRTMGALALTAKEAYRAPFEPLPGGVVHIPFGDIAALEAAVDETVAAVFLEPIQGEAGVRPLPAGYLKAAREATSNAGALLILDEVQTGIGRTGKWLASEDAGIVPDAITLAKGLGGGFPIGALITFGEATSSLLSAGQHGTTFGGNPVATAAALATLHALESQNVLANATAVGEHLRSALAAIPGVTEVRGEGLLIGFDLDADVAPAVVQAALDAGFIVNSPGPRTIRLAPPLILTTAQADTFLAAFPAILQAAKDAQ